MIRGSWVYALCAVAFAIGCSNNGGGSNGGTTANNPPADNTAPAPTTSSATGGYAAVQAIFTQRCAMCHGSAKPKGGIDLTSYEGIMKGGRDGAIVAAGDPDKSKLIDALRGHNGAMQMPKGQPPLSDSDIKTIEDWIKAGAKNG